MEECICDNIQYTEIGQIRENGWKSVQFWEWKSNLWINKKKTISTCAVSRRAAEVNSSISLNQTNKHNKTLCWNIRV